VFLPVAERSNALPTAEKEPDMFDIELEKESKPVRTPKTDSKSGPNPKRQKKNEKYGFGGKKKFSKSGDAFSTSDLRDFSVKKMKGDFSPKKRLGKSRRAKGRP
jgi:rRNA-processing protein EBP2